MNTYTNISGTTATTIIAKTTGMGNISSIYISNTHTVKYNFSVYLDTGSAQYYLLKNTELPAGAAIELTGDSVSFERKDYGLKVKLEAAGSGTSSATVITKKKV